MATSLTAQFAAIMAALPFVSIGEITEIFQVITSGQPTG